jgi:RHS repeat-associated protein
VNRQLLWSSPEETITTGVTPTNIQRDYLFTGKELDRNTGFYYFGARYLDPRTSSWLSTDPILRSYMEKGPEGALPQNLSLYSYAWNNPLVMRDPTRLATCSYCQMEDYHLEGVVHKAPTPTEG